MKQETLEYLAELEANASNMPYHDQTNFLLTALIRQVARIADALEQQNNTKRGY